MRDIALWLDISLTLVLLLFVIGAWFTLRQAVKDLGEYNKALTSIVREHLIGRVLVFRSSEDDKVVELRPVEPGENEALIRQAQQTSDKGLPRHQ